MIKNDKSPYSSKDDLEYRVTRLENQVIELQKLFSHVHDAFDLRTKTSEPQYPSDCNGG